MVDWLKKPYQSGGGLRKDSGGPFRNTGKKILAVVIAVALWMVANLQHDIETNVNLDVDYSNLPVGMVVTNNPPERISIRMRGPRNQLSSLSKENRVFTVDLTNVREGMSMFEITTDQIPTPREVQVTGISPAEIKVEIDRLATKNVAVVPTIGPPGAGYEIVGEPEVTPGKVKIEGPEKLITKVNSINTDPISVDKEKSKFTIEVPLRQPYALVSVVDDVTVKVTINLKEKTLEKEFNNLNINFVNFDDYAFETDNNVVAELSFEGPFSIINSLSSEDIELYVDGRDIRESNNNNRYRLKVSVDYPYKDLLKLKKQFPETVEIKLN